MAQSTDLYGILRGYALKNNSPIVVIDTFLKFLENYARLRVPEQPDWEKWAVDTETSFRAELPGLLENERCVLLAETAGDRLYMPFYYIEKLQNIYRHSDTMAEKPFPDAKSLKAKLPEGQMRKIDLASGLTPFLEKPDALSAPPEAGAEEAPPGEERRHTLVNISFPVPYGSALIPSFLIPRRLIEASFLKLQSYLQNRSNKEYLLHKLAPYFPDRERPSTKCSFSWSSVPATMLNLQSSGEFSSLFWRCFCSLVKTDVGSKEEDALLREDLAAVQAAYIIETCNEFYRARAAKKKEVELALRSLDMRMEQPPFYFTFDDIVKFTDDRGASLLGIYTNRDLEEHVKKRTAESDINELPDWLILQGKNNKRWYIKKNKYLVLCTKMLLECRPRVKKEVLNRWLQTLKDFRREASMERDDAFEKLLLSRTAYFNDTLMLMLEDPKLPLVYTEMDRSKAAVPAALRIVKDGRLLPMSDLYAFRRKDLLSDVQFMLPFWYSIPVLVSIIAFFKNR